MGADEGEQLLLALDAFGPRLGESRRDDAERARTCPQRFLGRGDHVLAGQADHAEVDRVGDLLERAVGAHAGDGLAGAVDGVGGAGEAAGEDVAEEEPADRAGRAEAPTTATVLGSKNGRSDAVTATWSRSSTRAR